MTTLIKTTVVFLRPFRLQRFNETLPPGEYEIETKLLDPADCIEPGTWTSSVLVHLHSRASHPGLGRTLTVPLAELASPMAKDKLTGKALMDFFLEEMLADPMIHLVMEADGVDEAELRDLFRAPSRVNHDGGHETHGAVVSQSWRVAKDAGPSIGSARPGIGE